MDTKGTFGDSPDHAQLVEQIRSANRALAASLSTATSSRPPDVALLCSQASRLVGVVDDLLAAIESLTAAKHEDVRPSSAPAEDADAIQSSGGLGETLVLVVDDNQDAADLLASLVEHLGYQAMVAHNGASALALVKERRPDVALLDLGLPIMNGYELAARLRSDPALAGLRIVAITGYGRPEDVQRTTEAGFDAHFLKPLDASALANLLSGR